MSIKYFYQYFDLILDSDICLPELPEVSDVSSSLSFNLKKSPVDVSSYNWLHHWKNNEDITISFAKSDGCMVLHFPDYASFIMDQKKMSIHCYPYENINISLIRHLLLDQVVPRFVSMCGAVVLHASAISVNGKCVIFIGKSGSGKSTLACSFHMHSMALLCDDCLQLCEKKNGLVCIPSYNGSRLWSDSFYSLINDNTYGFKSIGNGGKKRLILSPPQRGKSSFPVSAIFLLNRQSDKNSRELNNIKVQIEPFNGSDAVIALIECAFMLDLTDRQYITKFFENISRLVRSDVPIYQLDCCHEYQRLPEIRREILKIVERY